MRETNHFFNLGYGWLCKHCSAEDTDVSHAPNRGYAKAKVGGMPPLALAGSADGSQRTLTCPRCKIEELVSRI